MFEILKQEVEELTEIVKNQGEKIKALESKLEEKDAAKI